MGHLVYARYSPWHPRRFDTDDPRIRRAVLIYDVMGERGAQPLRDRLLAAPRAGATLVVLRGLSAALREDIADGLYDSDLDELFPEHTGVWDLVCDPLPRVVTLRGRRRVPRQAHLLKELRSIEVSALLHWSGAVWSPDAFHFVLPSGQHSNRFVRVADTFASQVDIDRIVDWCLDAVTAHTFLFLDTATLLPLAQALELRGRAAGLVAQMTVRVLPLYQFPPERVASAFAELDQWWSSAPPDSRTLLSLVSVSASGGYVRLLGKALRSCHSHPDVHSIIVCSTDSVDHTDCLCHVEAEPHPPDSCDAPLSAVEVDQHTFTTRVLVGVRVSQLPNYSAVSDLRPVIEELARHNALRVHVDRPGQVHLTAHIDTRAALACAGIRQLADHALQSATESWRPDLALIPSHEGTHALQEWLQLGGVTSTLPTRADFSIPDSVRDAILSAHRILLVDDALITTRTFRALLETVQRIKAQAGETEFDIRALVLFERCAREATVREFRKRFFIRGRSAYWHAVEMPLPDHATANTGSCPWCNERRYLESLLPGATGHARDYFDLRLARLRDSVGLDGRVFLLSDHSELTEPAAALATTAGSYMGSLSDVGACVFGATLVQRVRYGWQGEQTTYSSRRVISVQPLRYYTDPVIAGSLLRATHPGELWAAETESDVKSVLLELQHVRQHPVLAAEILFGVGRGKLPRTLPLQDYITPHSATPTITAILHKLLRAL